MVFFAGHGYTHKGRRGEVGYLVPVDGKSDDLSTLVRWDDLTRNSDLVPAKHILFIMDACYGGLALTRSPGPGSMRFLKNMLQRYARQVLTAGKADEVVADSGGPIPNHSIFTGHFLQALEGSAVSDDGILSANTVMAYIYEHVSKDQNSFQTPHFGFFYGDGDFIFSSPILNSLGDEPEIEKDVLIQIPPNLSVPSYQSDVTDPIEAVKEYIPEPRYRIKLDNIVTSELRRILYETADEKFPVQSKSINNEDLIDRLNCYEEIIRRFQSMIALLSYWGSDEHLPILRKAMGRVADNDKRGGGKVVWLGLRWYPTMLLLYSGGIASIASGNYNNLATILTTKIGSRFSDDKKEEIIMPVVSADLDLQRTDIWKSIPRHERQYVPRSEYLFKVIQPVLDDLFFLGRSYESMYDRFEVLFALVYADLDYTEGARIWGPPGRFAWKHSSIRPKESPFSEILKEAASQGENWPPLKAGLFSGSIERFEKISSEYADLISRLNWR